MSIRKNEKPHFGLAILQHQHCKQHSFFDYNFTIWQKVHLINDENHKRTYGRSPRRKNWTEEMAMTRLKSQLDAWYSFRHNWEGRGGSSPSGNTTFKVICSITNMEAIYIQNRPCDPQFFLRHRRFRNRRQRSFVVLERLDPFCQGPGCAQLVT